MTGAAQPPAGTAVERPGWRGIVTAWRDNPEWRKLFAARAISLLGGWLNTLVLLELVGTAQSAIALAVVFVLKQVPVTLLGPSAGVVADRFDRRRVVILCELVAAAVVLLFLVLEPGGPPVWVYVLTAAQMSVSAFFLPAYQAMVPSLVQPKDLVAANVASSATWSIMYALGMAAGGIVMVAFGWRVAIVLDALTYVLSALLVVSIRYTSVARPPRQGTGLAKLLGIDEMRAGLRYIVRDTEVSRIILVKFGWGTMGAVTLFLALLGATPTYTVSGSGTAGASYLWGCRALGTLFGPLLAYRFAGHDPLRLKRAITWAFFLAPLVYMLVALTNEFWLGGLFVFVAHLGGSTLWVISTVLLQQIVPENLRGRTFAAELGLVMLSSSISTLVYAAVLDSGLIALQPTMLLASSVCLVPAYLWYRGTSRRFARARS